MPFTKPPRRGFSLDRKLFSDDRGFKCRPQRQEMKTLVRLWKRQLVKARITLLCTRKTLLKLWRSLYFKVADDTFWGRKVEVIE